MKKLLPIILQNLACFGLIASIASLANWLISGNIPLHSDDNYIMGWAAACFIMPGIVLYQVGNHFAYKRLTVVRLYIAYIALAITVLAFTMFNGELHGPGIALQLIAFIMLLGFLALLIMQQLSRQWFLALGLLVTILYAAAFGAVWF